VEPAAFRLDRMSGTFVERVAMRFGEPPDPASPRWWADVAPAPGGFRALLSRRETGGSAARVLEIPAPRGGQRRSGGAAGLWLRLPPAPAGDAFEGFCVAGDRVYAVRSAGGGASALAWRAAP
jgi:hypothetical protein